MMNVFKFLILWKQNNDHWASSDTVRFYKYPVQSVYLFDYDLIEWGPPPIK